MVRHLVQRRDVRARIVRPENRTKILPGAGSPDRAPLTHSHSMTIARAANRESLDRAIPARRGLDGEERAVQDLPAGRTQHVADVVAAQDVVATIGGDFECADATRGSVGVDLDITGSPG